MAGAPASRSDRGWIAAACVAAIPAVAMPVGDPDLWWHLSAARWMVRHRTFPRADWLSFTLPGAPWTDFEWASQLILYATWLGAGLLGLWLLKIFLLSWSGASLFGAMKDRGVSAPYRAAGLALWSASIIARSDIRIELFSLALFLWLSRASFREELRPALAFPLFCVWANVHGAFAYGLLFLGLYAAVEFAASFVGERRARHRARARGLFLGLCAGTVAACVNPYGWGIYGVLWRHLREVGDMSGIIIEWGPLRWNRPSHWGVWATIALTFLAAFSRRERDDLRSSAGQLMEFAPLLAVFGLLAWRHSRLSPYFCALAIPWAFQCLSRGGYLRATDLRGMPLAAFLIAGAAALAIWCGRSIGVLRRASHDVFFPIRAADFIARRPEIFSGNVYHPWGWGGYFGFFLPESFRVFEDGRYIFHPLILETARAVSSPAAWQAFFDRYRISTAVMENVPVVFSDSQGKYRPYYVAYMPPARWALVYWDDRALVFVRRGSIPKEKLGELEYAWARPSDDAAIAADVAAGKVDQSAVGREFARHERELAAAVGHP